MKFLRPPVVSGRPLVGRVQPGRPASSHLGELVDTEHTTGPLWLITVNINDGRIEETCRVHAGQAGLACNRAMKLVKDKHRQRMKTRTVVFTCEVV